MKTIVKDPDTFTCLDISTVHVMKEDLDFLNTPECPICAYDFMYGHFVCVPFSRDTQDLKEIESSALSKEFVKIIKLASTKGYRLVKFDCDGTVYDDLPKFDW